ncbi:MAG: hypothetical protein ACE5H3_08585 [Planctomycetota bacterium]
MLSLGFLASLLVAGCGGGGVSGVKTSSAVAGLSLPDGVSVVTANGAGSAGSGSSTSSGVIVDGSAFPPDSDFNVDQADFFVFDPSMESFDTVNQILCLINQTAADKMVNKGPYRALVDENRCETTQSQAQGPSTANQSSGARGTTFNEWTVKSTRADNQSDEIVRIWVPMEDQGMTSTIFGKSRVLEDPSDLLPFGKFVMNFKATENPNGSGMTFFQGVLRSVDALPGRVGFNLFQSEGIGVDQPHPNPRMESFEDHVVVDMTGDKTSGSAHILTRYRENFGMGDSGLQEQESLIAFDSTHFLRKLGTDPPVLFFRDQFVQNVFSYNLYHAEGPNAGQRVKLNSGFPIRTQAGQFGWIGYWGLWLPDGVQVGNGDTIFRSERRSSQETPLTVLQAPGKLIKHTQKTLTLAEIDGMIFQWWDYDETTMTGEQVELQYTAATDSWAKIATWDDATQAWVTLEAPVDINLQPGQWLGMWSESLQGSVNYIAGEANLNFWVETFVNGADPDLFPAGGAGQVTFYALTDLTKPGLTAAEAEAGDTILPPRAVANPYQLVFAKSDLTLFLDPDGSGTNLQEIGLAPGEVPTSGPFVWGMQTGPLVLQDPAAIPGVVNPWDLWNVPVFYTYETGPNAWNHYTAVVDGTGSVLTFDPPITINYVHSTANDANGDSTFDGQTFQLHYGGDGQFWGIPFNDADLTGDGQDDRSFPLFSIKDGVVVGPSNEYVLKAAEGSLLLMQDVAGSSTLDLAGAQALTLPDGSSFVDPTSIGSKPVVTDPPAVIAGVVQ